MVGTFTIVWQIGLFMMVEDLFFYLAHALFHHPKFYWIHKRHHEYTCTISLAVEHAHPIEFIMANMIPTGPGYKILSNFYPLHMITILVWIAMRLIESTEGHSGYEWTFSYTSIFPLGAGPEYHNFHHSNNVGNYASYTIIWDTLFGSNEEYYKFLELKESN